MMYWDFPSVTPADRLERSPALDAAKLRVSPAEAYAASGLTQLPAQARLSTFDGRPVYRFRAEQGENLVYADTGERQLIVSRQLMERSASAWTGQPAIVATVSSVDID